jgi:PKD repeat protein
MNKLLLAVASLALSITTSAQIANTNTVTVSKDGHVPSQRTCGVMDHEQYLESINPNRAAERQAFEQQVQNWIAANVNQPTVQAAINIPVVVHVVYNNAAQNISNAQVNSQITVLNQDFTATNTDVGLVPSVWTSLVANVDVNFCLAQQDPSGNPTTGINRVSTSVTSFSTNDAVKSSATGGVNAWDPSRYFNIWCCNLGGGVLGYAEFPTGTLSQTYGLVVGYTCFGNTGTATPPYNLGRTATHEIGHCFNLRHIWGDDGTACTGSDLVADTPNQADENYGCPTFPSVSCSNGPNGDMWMNYMDYTNDACMYMFTNGQKTRMLAVINSTPYNSLQTSTACTPPASAPPVALFSISSTAVCPGTPVTFTDQSTVNTTSWAWTFPSGSPASSNVQNPPTVTWSTPGTYTVTLVASNVNGSSTYTMAVTVLGTVNPPLTEGFEAATFPPTNWSQYDAGANGIVWARFNAGRNSSFSAKFDNYNLNVAGARDELRTPRMNFSTASTVTMTFDVAYRQYSTLAAEQDTLEVAFSTNCGATWTQVYIKGSSTLSTVAGTQTTAFTPTNTQWRNESVTMNAAAGNGGVIICFRNRGHYGNNIYVDNVNITTTTSALPSATFTASATSVCAGTPVSFTDNSTNSPTSWTWTFPSGTPASATTQNVASVVWNTAGTYTVTHTATNGSGTGTTTQTITVLANPTVTTTTSGGTICSGNSTTITGSGASTYNWMPGSLTGTTVTVSPAGTTTYTVTGTAANGCTGTATRTITVNPSPTVTATSSTTTICSGSSLTLTGGGAATYNWNPGNLNGGTVTVSPAGTTTYTVTGTAANGCTGTATRTITVNPTPTVTTTTSTATICAGSSATITASGATTYTWMPGSLSGSPVTVSPTTTTTYTVTGTSGGCSGTATRTITVNPAPSLTMTPVSGAVTICQGSSTTISGSTTANHTYSWSPTAGLATPNAASTVASPTVTTTYVLTKTRTSTGCTVTGTVVVTVNPAPNVTATPSSSSICTGNSVTLTGSGASTYNWQPGNLNGSSVTTTPASTTTYTVTGTGANGCTATSTVMVTVGSQPTVTATSSSPSICTGGSATLTGSGGTTYTWMPGSLSGSTVTVSPSSTTTYTVTGSNGPGCSNTGTVTVTVNSLPTVSASVSNSTVCEGTSVALTGSGATNYTWMPGSLNGASVNDTPTSTTTYTLTGTDANGCSNTSTVLVNVNALPSISASSSAPDICEGSSVTLTGNGAVNYDWMPGSLNGASVVDSPVSSTTYTVTGTDANGCSNTTTVSVNVNALPSVSITLATDTFCDIDGPTMLSGGSPAGGNYSGTGVTANAFDPSSVGAGTFAITYTFTDVNGCTNSASQSVVVDVCSGIGSTDNETPIDVMPNPNNGNFTLGFTSASAQDYVIEIHNSLGQVVYTEQLTNFSGTYRKDISLSENGTGLYFIRLRTVNSESTLRVITQ